MTLSDLLFKNAINIIVIVLNVVRNIMIKHNPELILIKGNLYMTES